MLLDPLERPTSLALWVSSSALSLPKSVPNATLSPCLPLVQVLAGRSSHLPFLRAIIADDHALFPQHFLPRLLLSELLWYFLFGCVIFLQATTDFFFPEQGVGINCTPANIHLGI